MKGEVFTGLTVLSLSGFSLRTLVSLAVLYLVILVREGHVFT